MLKRILKLKLKNRTALLFVLIAIGLVFAIRQTILHSGSNPNVIAVQIENQKIVNRDKKITVKQNKTITFQISSDKTEDFHIEGYHAFQRVHPGKTYLLTIQTLTPGKFPIILDQSKTHIGELIISPD